MTDFKTFETQRRGLGFYRSANVLLFTQPITLHFNQIVQFYVGQSSNFADSNMTQLTIVVGICMIYAMAMYLLAHLVMRWLTSSQTLSAKKMVILSNGVLSICWLLLSNMQRALNGLTPPLLGGPSPMNGYSGQPLRRDDENDEKQIPWRAVLPLFVFWLLTLSLISIAIGMIVQYISVEQKRLDQENEDARASEQQLEPAESTPLLLPLHRETSREVDHSGEPVHRGRSSYASVTSLNTGRRNDQPSAVGRFRLFASSCRNMALGVFSLLFCQLQILFLPQAFNLFLRPIDLPWSEPILSLGNIVLTLEFVAHGVIASLVMALIGVRLGSSH